MPERPLKPSPTDRRTLHSEHAGASVNPVAWPASDEPWNKLAGPAPPKRALTLLRHLQPAIKATVHKVFIKADALTKQRPFERTELNARVRVTEDGLAGDDNLLSCPERAVLLQSSAHCAIVRQTFMGRHEGGDPRMSGVCGSSSGENLLVSGVDVHTVCIGDIWRFGTLVLQVTSPRKPCKRWTRTYQSEQGKAGLRSFVTRNTLGGWFCRVICDGEIGPGDVMTLESRPHPRWTLQRVGSLVYGLANVPDDSSAEPVWNGTEEELHELLALEPLANRDWRSCLSRLVTVS